MKPAIFVRSLADAERQQLEAGLRSSEAFTLRRCQSLLASSRGERPSQIAQALDCTSQTVPGTLWVSIRAFSTRGLDALQEGPQSAGETGAAGSPHPGLSAAQEESVSDERDTSLPWPASGVTSTPTT